MPIRTVSGSSIEHHRSPKRLYILQLLRGVGYWRRNLFLEGVRSTLYDDLTVEEAKKKLDGLSECELKKIRPYEKEHKTARPSSSSWTIRSGSLPALFGPANERAVEVLLPYHSR